MTWDEVHYAQKEPLEFSNLYRGKSGDYLWKNDGRNAKDQAECIDRGSPSLDFPLNVASQVVRKGSDSFVGWLAG